MMAMLIAMALCSAVLILGKYISSLRPASLTVRISRSSSTVQSGDFLRNLMRLLNDKFGEALGMKKAKQRVLFELPDFLELLSVSISAGESIYSSLARVVPRLSGQLATELKVTLRALELGSDMPTELDDLAMRLPQRQVIEFCNKLNLALRRGTALAKVLDGQAESVRQEVLNQLTKQAGKNETRMLVPLVFLILPVTVLFAVYPSLKLLNIAYL